MKLIGVTHISFDQDFVRNQLFLFDQLLVLSMERAISTGGDFQQERTRAQCELDFLAERRLVRWIYPIEYSWETKSLPDKIVEKFDAFPRDSDTWKAFAGLIHESENYWQRYAYGFCRSEPEAIRAINTAVALQLRAHTLLANISRPSQFAVCSDSELQAGGLEPPAESLHVVSIVLDQIPIIPDMPYDEVIDFRADLTSRRLHDRLKLWITQISTRQQDHRVVRAEIEQAIVDYREFVSRQCSRSRLLQIELFVKAPLEVIESLIRLSPSRAVGSIIEIRRKQIDLLEAELRAPGRQFAYIREIQRLAAQS